MAEGDARCELCEFYSLLKDDGGACLRYPPTVPVNSDPFQSAQFPVVKAIWICGEFKSKRQRNCTLSCRQWLNLNGHDAQRAHLLGFADEQLEAGYSYDEIVAMFKWHNKRTFLPILRAFCEDRKGEA